MSLHNEVRSMNGPTKLCLIAAALTGLASCGGSTQQAAVTASLISDGAGEKIMSSGPESGPPTKVHGNGENCQHQFRGQRNRCRICEGRRSFLQS